ncbi:MAG TPA: cohesin domain-containing protein [Candidatus Saccharimonadales bacterium]|nr:cohesin domain-containing protein [Candidatus Saccharimonadales bacterium]
MWDNNNFFAPVLIFAIIVIVVSSWILIHVLALFGVFLAFAYPLWWLFAPNQTVCLLCRAEKDGTICPICRQQIVKSAGVAPKTFISSVLNGGIILLFSLLSILIVYGEGSVLFHLGFPPTSQTASFTIPDKGQHLIGEIFPLKILINNIKNPINAVQVDLGFNPAKVEVVGVSTQDSFAKIFIQKTIDNTSGYVRLTGGIPNPGWAGTNGLFETIYLKAKSSGLVTITYLPSSLVLANDGSGTNVLKYLPSISYLILSDKVSPETEKAQQKLISQKVLGASTENDQLDFADDTNVLGISTSAEIAEKNTPNLPLLAAGGLEAVDRFILNAIGSAIHVVKE